VFRNEQVEDHQKHKTHSYDGIGVFGKAEFVALFERVQKEQVRQPQSRMTRLVDKQLADSSLLSKQQLIH
jgi:hypothetical protein